MWRMMLRYAAARDAWHEYRNRDLMRASYDRMIAKQARINKRIHG